MAPLKLSDLTKTIEKVVSTSFAGKNFWVIAEAINITKYEQRRNCFLKLIEKEEKSDKIVTSVDCVIWGARYQQIEAFEQATLQKFKDNIQLLVNVKVSYHINYGLKLEIQEIDHSFTIGRLELARQQVLAALVAKNPFITLQNGEYFTTNKQVEFKPVIQNIALISSPHSDGHNDFMDEICKNKFGYSFNIKQFSSQVQGSGASAQIIQRLIDIYNANENFDVVVIVRGGGSQIDFSAFDTYELARAVAKFPFPIITGIGHEKNECITDLMAKLKTKTPTKAASTIIVHNRNFEVKILELQKRVILRSKIMLAGSELTINKLSSNFVTKTRDLLDRHQSMMRPLQNIIIQKTVRALDASYFNIDKYKYRLTEGLNNYNKSKQNQLSNFALTVRHLSPENVLKRGYAMVYHNGKILKDLSTLQKGDAIKTVSANIEISSTITEKTEIKQKENHELNI